MRLENQVCSLELAKKLKELGVEQNAYFTYIGYPDENGSPDETRKYEIKASYMGGDIGICSVFTVAELGELFPKVKWVTSNMITRGKINIFLNANEPYDRWFEAKTEANCRAKMLIYLIENNLIN